MSVTKNWFDVDKEGLAKLLADRSPAFVLFELFSNCADTDAKKIEITLTPVVGKPFSMLVVRDDDPRGFALDLNTPIPTPDGWSTMREIKIGDKVFDDEGRIRYVTMKTPTMEGRPCFAVKFDEEEIVADANHLWRVTTDLDRSRGNPNRILTTTQLHERLSKSKPHFSTGMQPVLDAPFTDRKGLIDPYILGYWLGDGSVGAGQIACGDADAPFIMERCQAAGYSVKRYGPHMIGVKGLAPDLARAGVFERKHIPRAYFRTDASTRLALLGGLVDSDGSTSGSEYYRRGSFYNTNHELLDGVEELIWSLGGKSSRRLASPAGRKRTNVKGHLIVQRKDYYAISFALPFDVFVLPRKAASFRTSSDRQRRRIIRSVTPCGLRDVACIQVDAPSGMFLCGRTMIATHNCDISHAWTLFAESVRKGDAEKRGRFNLGEKLVLASCVDAEILTTTGGVRFDAEGRHVLRRRTEKGSVFEAMVRMTRESHERALEEFIRVIPPEGVEVFFNGSVLPRPERVASFSAKLPTVVADAEGFLRRVERETIVDVYEPKDRYGMIFELGVPVVETFDRFDYDVRQKIPLTSDRDNVPPAYLRMLRALALNATAGLLSKEDASRAWVQDAASSKLVTPEANDRVLTLQFGEKRAVYDPSDPEANKELMNRGYAIIHGGALSAERWENVRRDGIAAPSGKIAPSGTRHSTDGDPERVVDPAKYTAGQRGLVEFAQDLAFKLIARYVEVRIVNEPIALPHAAWYSRSNAVLTFNLGRLGKAWFDGKIERKHVELILHELAHDRVSDHLTREFADEVGRLAAKALDLALIEPAFYTRHGYAVMIPGRSRALPTEVPDDFLNYNREPQ